MLLRPVWRTPDRPSSLQAHRSHFLHCRRQMRHSQSAFDLGSKMRLQLQVADLKVFLFISPNQSRPLSGWRIVSVCLLVVGLIVRSPVVMRSARRAIRLWKQYFNSKNNIPKLAILTITSLTAPKSASDWRETFQPASWTWRAFWGLFNKARLLLASNSPHRNVLIFYWYSLFLSAAFWYLSFWDFLLKSFSAL